MPFNCYLGDKLYVIDRVWAAVNNCDGTFGTVYPIEGNGEVRIVEFGRNIEGPLNNGSRMPDTFILDGYDLTFTQLEFTRDLYAEMYGGQYDAYSGYDMVESEGGDNGGTYLSFALRMPDMTNKLRGQLHWLPMLTRNQPIEFSANGNAYVTKNLSLRAVRDFTLKGARGDGLLRRIKIYNKDVPLPQTISSFPIGA